MQEGYIGEIRLFGGNFAPRGWALCEGQLLAISSNQALFSILGTTYGGDGRTTFALPDLRGRSAIQQGSGPGLSTIRLGEKGGTETTTLSVNNMPNHDHTVTPNCNTGNGKQTTPKSGFPATVVQGANTANGYTADSNATMGATTTSKTGGGQSFNNRSPFLGLNFIIALQGVYPSRN